MPHAISLAAAGLLLFLALRPSLAAVTVLPRPPPSSRHLDRGWLDERPIQSAGLERADSPDYRLLEIEVRSPSEEADLENLVHAVFAQPQREQGRRGRRPKLGLVANSALVGKRAELRSGAAPSQAPTPQGAAGGVYYAHIPKPNVYVNVRGVSGSYTKYTGSKGKDRAPSLAQLLQLQPTEWKMHNNVKLKDRPLPYQGPWNEASPLQTSDAIRRNGRVTAYDFTDLTTTESSVVTSSELPKQIPAPPPGTTPIRSFTAQTTPVHRYHEFALNI